ncbi:MAG TPA: DUF1702 family protein [Pseudonocardiaceae bacterium]|nr:DUF1702 family protein [Pseudonocardiaceae bacterium]
MPTTLGSLRRLVFTPKLAAVSFAGRGFDVAPTEASRKLEAVPQAVVCGFEWGIDAVDLWEVESRLALVDQEQRGFAFEGATMAFTILDAMGGGHRTRDLLAGEGQRHIFLAYIGIGFAMAKLPRMLWRKVLPDLDGTPYHPTMSWLAVDGYGFDLAYFHTKRWVQEQRVPAPYPWDGAPDYFHRAVDQGIGRALWFMNGGVVPDVSAALRRFAPQRHADLWSGVGLASTFAGGTDGAGLRQLRREAGEHAADLALGAVFAIKARDYAGFVPPHSAAATQALTGLSVEAAVKVADIGAGGQVRATEGAPAYEHWRRLIKARLQSDSAAA